MGAKRYRKKPVVIEAVQTGGRLMGDIVERLRSVGWSADWGTKPLEIACRDAADEIERLRAAVRHRDDFINETTDKNRTHRCVVDGCNNDARFRRRSEKFGVVIRLCSEHVRQ